jgi:hypothetical protein
MGKDANEYTSQFSYVMKKQWYSAVVANLINLEGQI